ncbi:MAG: RnfABCDGE type electron transport complex subunit G [Lachnospiraceae bacterium]|nr:RnfABCDGE type electron transport complex subunit G [Lachnospiraceae bacterium]
MQNKGDVMTMLREAGILFAITLAAGLALGFVYELTKDTIAQQEALAQSEACKAVFADAAEFNEIDYTLSEALNAENKENGVEIGIIYEACDSTGAVLGYVVEAVSGEGYGGDIGLYLGITSDGTLNGVSILEISETVGLGMQAEEVLVPQFSGKTVSQFTYTKTGSTRDNEIDAISGATITTEAFVNAVNGGLMAAAELSGGGAANE